MNKTSLHPFYDDACQHHNSLLIEDKSLPFLPLAFSHHILLLEAFLLFLQQQSHFNIQFEFIKLGDCEDLFLLIFFAFEGGQDIVQVLVLIIETFDCLSLFVDEAESIVFEEIDLHHSLHLRKQVPDSLFSVFVVEF